MCYTLKLKEKLCLISVISLFSTKILAKCFQVCHKAMIIPKLKRKLNTVLLTISLASLKLNVEK